MVLGDIKLKAGNPLACHVVLGDTMLSKDKLPNLVAIFVLLGHTTINKDKQVVHHVVLENTMINKDNLVAKTIAMLAPTSNKIKKHV